MADLEDFFAKRDKKKKTKGQKFESAGMDDVAKILEAKVKERKKQETNKSTYQVPASDSTDQPPSDYRAQEDDEWKEVVEEKPDYTGLKIQELVLEDEDESGGKDANGQDEVERLKEGPWRKDRKPQPVPTRAVPDPPPSPPTEEVQVETENVSESQNDANSPVVGSPVSEKSETITETTTNEAPTPEVAAQTPEEPPSEPEPPKKAVYIPAARRAAMEAAAKEQAAKDAARPPPTIPRPAPVAPISATTDSTSAAPASTAPSKPPGAYVPPSRRGVVPGSTSSVSTKPKKHVPAPNINDEQYFPSLGEVVPGKQS